MLLLLLQVAAPLLLFIAVAVPCRSRILKGVQTIAAASYLVAVHRAGLWLDLPSWTVWLLWMSFGLAILWGLTSQPSGKRGRWQQNSALVVWCVVALGSGWLAIEAILGGIPPQAPVVDLANPLPPGRYMVVNGGSNSLVNAHFETLHPKTRRQALYRGQSYGVDVVGLYPNGMISHSWRPKLPNQYAIFGTSIISPCDGEVIETMEERPDMPIPQADESVMTGNVVALRCGQVQVLLAHMRCGSVIVHPRQSVRTGQKLGEVGNSGNTGAPHLHIHAQQLGPPGSIFAADPLPIRIGGRYPVRGNGL